MANEVNREFIAALAAANGLDLPDKRLDRVLKQYQSFMRQIARLDAFELKREAEPSVTFSLAKNMEPPAPSAQRKAAGGSNGK